MMASILKFMPWLAMAGGLIFGLFRHQQAKTATADADQKMADADRKLAESNAAAAGTAVAAAKERNDVENDIAARPADDANQRLHDRWSAE